MTPEEYLKFERESEIRHEYLDGEIFAMTGASERHILIVGSTHFSLYGQLDKRPCKVYMSDMRVRVKGTSFYTYPDISVVCGEAEFEDDILDTLLNPTVIFEVLSPSTESYNRGKKFQQYRELESLQEYVLIAQDTMRIEHYLRQGEQWLLTDARGPDAVVALPSIGCELKLSDVYAKVTFESDRIMTLQENANENRAIELFKAWFVKPISTMDIDGGFVAFIVALALYERLIDAKLKLKNKPRDDKSKRDCMSQDLQLSDEQRQIFWDMFRIGLLHQAMPKAGATGFILDRSFTEQPKLKYLANGRPVFCIDPLKFYDRVIKEFLNNPHLITASESFPLAQVGEIQFDQLTDLPPEEPKQDEALITQPQNHSVVVTGVIKTDHPSSDGDPLE